ncbi:uncharacterized protein EI90DRAFT_3029424 [Cantharellus anzutake]|uniref:uncharacterized protein n=1 Tax=Cantharellus anzutake TaxID=1750568 RepID=UPI001908DA97|nr:uncharacterized protein EI90DRAFT_3029424 [Cantharellus anzutake]KAF8342562.1 hypothetical protein EI90DRAFT_3029424 [Cantharellus anzutake]
MNEWNRQIPHRLVCTYSTDLSIQQQPQCQSRPPTSDRHDPPTSGKCSFFAFTRQGHESEPAGQVRPAATMSSRTVVKFHTAPIRGTKGLPSRRRGYLLPKMGSWTKKFKLAV